MTTHTSAALLLVGVVRRLINVLLLAPDRSVGVVMGNIVVVVISAPLMAIERDLTIHCCRPTTVPSILLVVDEARVV